MRQDERRENVPRVVGSVVHETTWVSFPKIHDIIDEWLPDTEGKS